MIHESTCTLFFVFMPLSKDALQFTLFGVKRDSQVKIKIGEYRVHFIKYFFQTKKKKMTDKGNLPPGYQAIPQPGSQSPMYPTEPPPKYEDAGAHQQGAYPPQQGNYCSKQG